MMPEKSFSLSLRDETICARDETNPCLTCSDAVETVRVIRLDETSGLALVEWKQDTLEIDVSLLEVVRPGDLLLIHGGVALSLAEGQ